MIWIIFQFPAVKSVTPIRITSQFNITEEIGMIMMRNMCYVKDNLVATISYLEESTNITKVLDQTSNLVKEWASCHPFRSVMAFEIHGKDYLLEGCVICKIIRGYEFPQIESKILCEGIFPNAMCKGPDGTILVFDNQDQSLKQMRYCDEQFLLEKEFSVGCADVHSLCLSENCDLVMALHCRRKTLTGFHFPSGQVAWQHKH